MANIKGIFIKVAAILLVLLCIILVIVGQKSIGYEGLSLMLLGLSGLVALLAIYNKKYK